MRFEDVVLTFVGLIGLILGVFGLVARADFIGIVLGVLAIGMGAAALGLGWLLRRDYPRRRGLDVRAQTQRY